jgi:hypothetical protein
MLIEQRWTVPHAKSPYFYKMPSTHRNYELFDASNVARFDNQINK